MKVRLRRLRHVRPLTPEESAVLEEFCRTMRDEVIPAVTEDIMEREVLAIESRARLL
jgi:hypothetical protein